MSKMLKQTLVIVESPAKCKKIEEYLGNNYKCIASFGHLRELPSLKNINMEENFQPTYSIIENNYKKKQIELLQKEIDKSDEVILATDDDREGEAIAWHICDLFQLDTNNTKRILFNEITKTAIQFAIENPTKLNMHIVRSQQARQILDLLVGFKVSPMLWKYISKNSKNSLSAGRCQTPALKIIYDNYSDRKEIEERKSYNTTGIFTNANIVFSLNTHFETENDVKEFLQTSIHHSHVFTCSDPKKIFKNPPEPLTTSSLQQKASNEFHYSPKETMQICQELYEKGYITYMRTDAKKYSKEFISSVEKYIVKHYCQDMIPTTYLFETNNVLQEEAHESIRCTNISLSEIPETINMNTKERKMYKIIWEHTLESCMAPASFFSITSKISAAMNTKFSYTCEQVHFPGWKIVSKKYLKDITLDNNEYAYLQKIKSDSIIPFKKIISVESLTGTKSHFTEASLVQLLEEKGIGRPSTFSSLVDKIQERGYVIKKDIKGKKQVCKDFILETTNIVEVKTEREFGNEKNKLVIQPLGIIVIEFLYKHFSKLFDYDYTKQMEENLDEISKGKKVYYEICQECNLLTDKMINGLMGETKKEIRLDEKNTYIIGKYGPVIKCVEDKITKFKPLRSDIDINIENLEKGQYKVEDIICSDTCEKQHILGQYNEMNVILCNGKFGLYIKWNNLTKSLKELENKPIEEITMDEVKKYLEEGNNIVREIKSSASIRKGARGDYLYYKTIKMKKPKFFDIKLFLSETNADYKTCNISILVSWILTKYNIKL
jgi:DNA topoisomerase-1